MSSARTDALTGPAPGTDGTVFPPLDPVTLRNLRDLLQAETGFDLMAFRTDLLARKLQRRLGVQGIDAPPSYLATLEQHPEEIRALLRSVLPTPARLLPNEEAVRWFETHLCPPAFDHPTAEGRVRAWLIGCGTGESAYALSALLNRYAGQRAVRPLLQVFATDLDDEALATARLGRYPHTLKDTVAPPLLESGFTVSDDHYHANATVRRSLFFSRHNITRDAPFSRMDLIVCRGLLGSLRDEVQESLLRGFARALGANGRLLLDPGLPINRTAPLFVMLDSGEGLYTPVPPPVMPEAARETVLPPRAPKTRPVHTDDARLDELHRRFLLENYSPPGLIVGDDFEIIHLFGGAGKYLALQDGAPSRNLLTAVDEALRVELRAALFRVFQHEAPTAARVLRFRPAHLDRPLDIVIRPFPYENALLAHVAFRELPPDAPTPARTNGPDEVYTLVEQLETELEKTKHQLEDMLEAYDVSRLELQGVDLELRSTVDELSGRTDELGKTNRTLQNTNAHLNADLEAERAALRRLEALVHASGTAAVLLDADLRIRSFTPAATGPFNLIPSDVGRPLAHIRHRLQWDTLVESLHEARAAGTPSVHRCTTEDGRTAVVRLVPLSGSDTPEQDLIALIVEIPEHAVEASIPLEGLQMLLSDLPVPILVHTHTGEVLAASQAWTGRFGVPDGNTPLRLAPDPSAPSSDKAPAFEPGSVLDGSYKVITGEDITNVWWFHSRMHALPGRPGRVIVTAALDAAMFRESGMYTAWFFRTSGDLLCVTDAEGCILVSNPAWQTILGYQTDELATRSLLGLVAAEDRASSRMEFERLARSTGPVTFECRMLASDGSQRWISWRAVPHPDGERLFFSGDDSTERMAYEQNLRAAREEAERASRTKSAFLASMSHEIRTPLTSIVGFADVLAEKTTGPFRELANHISKGGLRLTETLNSVLNLASLEGRGARLNPVTLDLTVEIEEVLQMFRLKARQKGLALRFVPPEAPIHLVVDSMAFRRILTNLVSNALKFTQKGHVTVHLSGDAALAEIRVEDSGVGISEAFMPYVFDPFRQEFGGRRGFSEGSGLGMSITKRLVELLRGTIQVTSESGAGTTFTVRLSSLTPDADDETGRSAEPQVLILADRPDTRKLLGLLLEDRVAIELTADLEGALAAAKRERYTLVLVDVNALRDPTGVEALNTLRTLPKYDAVPFVAVTAHVMPGERRSLLADGFDDVLPKPFSKAALLDLLGRHIPGL